MVRSHKTSTFACQLQKRNYSLSLKSLTYTSLRLSGVPYFFRQADYCLLFFWMTLVLYLIHVSLIWKTACSRKYYFRLKNAVFWFELTNLIDPDSDRKWDGRLFGLNSRPAPMSLRHASRHFDPLLLRTPSTCLEVGFLTIQFVFWLFLGLEVHTSLLWLLRPLLNLRVYHVCTYSWSAHERTFHRFAFSQLAIFFLFFNQEAKHWTGVFTLLIHTLYVVP